MISAVASLRPPARIERAINRWFDTEASGRALWVLLGLFVASWFTYQVVHYAPVGLHFDQLEAYSWSRHLAAGYHHPPLLALVTAAWFSAFPVADWSFRLLATLNLAAALYTVDLIARRYLAGDKRLLVLLLLLLTPFYQFIGQRLNANAILLPLWPLATYCFLRSFEARSLGWSAAAGAAAALAMLGKYYSIFLLAGFVVAALYHPARREYLKSPAPWVSVLAGVAVLAPHLHWLLTNDLMSIGYVYEAHGRHTTAMMIWAEMSYAAGGLAYVALPVAVFLLAARAGRRTLAAALWPADPDRRMLVILLAVPLLLPMLVAPLIGIRLTSLWTMSAWFLLPIVLLAPSGIAVPRRTAVRIAFAVLCYTAVMVAASPALAVIKHRHDSARAGDAHFIAASREVTRIWRETTQRPLTIVSGDYAFALAVTFYDPSHPDAFAPFAPQWTPWVTDARRAREGWAAICPAADTVCLELVARYAAKSPDVLHSEFENRATFLGMTGPPVRFVVVLAPPAK